MNMSLFFLFKCLDFPDQPEASAGQKNQDVENNDFTGPTCNADRRSGRQVGHKHSRSHTLKHCIHLMN